MNDNDRRLLGSINQIMTCVFCGERPALGERVCFDVRARGHSRPMTFHDECFEAVKEQINRIPAKGQQP